MTLTPASVSILRDASFSVSPLAAGRIQHDANFHAPPVRRDHGVQQVRIGENEHLDPQRFGGVRDGVEDRPGGIIRHGDEVTRHGMFPL